ncbi:MAG: DUF853 domain-containing protein [Planctomycetota bacterium]|jgi:DNA helicase HerA-like ATPase|nr:DUF853 domain-containing protein [Planctomycetota bacterium]
MLDKENRPLIARNRDASLYLLPSMCSRHGLVAGATGTGKTVSLQVIAESLSALGVPVFITDIKGDVSGISQSGSLGGKVGERVESLGLAADGFEPQGCPVCFWDVFGEQGHPLRTTISEMGPLLLSRVLDLNDTQGGVLELLFRIADDNGLLLLDLKDLRKLTEYISQNRAEFTASHGNMAPTTLGAIQRGLVSLEGQGGDNFFGEPALQIQDLMRRSQGKGVVNILAADKLMQSPRVYGSFLLWLLSDLHESLPEVGDLEQPKLALFFDEAHLIFSNAPKPLLERIEQTARLIRSKGVGVFFITQNPADVPETVLAQLGNRVQHALRAYTPGEQKAVRAAAQAFRANPAFRTEDAITDLHVGEALVSLLDVKGAPVMVERATMLPPQSRIGPISPEERQRLIQKSLLHGQYERQIDRESAYEVLTARILRRNEAMEAKKAAKAKPQKSLAEEIVGDFAKKTQQSISRNFANQIGRSLLRGILGTLFGKK